MWMPRTFLRVSSAVIQSSGQRWEAASVIVGTWRMGTMGNMKLSKTNNSNEE